MSKEDYKGYKVLSEVTCRLGEDGFWVVDQKLSHQRLLDSGEWESREATVSSRAKAMEDALGQSYLSMSTYLDTVSGDLFNEKNKEEKGLLN